MLEQYYIGCASFLRGALSALLLRLRLSSIEDVIGEIEALAIYLVIRRTDICWVCLLPDVLNSNRHQWLEFVLVPLPLSAQRFEFVNLVRQVQRFGSYFVVSPSNYS